MQLSIARKKAYELLLREGLLSKGWTVSFDDSKKRLGACFQKEKKISISRYFIALNPDEETLNTILHEIAHAKTPGDNNHGSRWKKEAVRLGASPEACAYDAVAPDGDFVGSCQSCPCKIFKHREPPKIGTMACGVCCRRHNAGKWSPAYLYVWTNERTGEIFLDGAWVPNPGSKMLEISGSAVAGAFVRHFGPTAVIDLCEVGKIREFKFDEYDYRYKASGVFRAYLEAKLWRFVGKHKVLKSYWRIKTAAGIVIDVWESQYSGRYETADKRVDVENLRVGKWYELIVMDTNKGYPRLQSIKLNS